MALGLASCATTMDFSSWVVQYNKSVEQAQNRMTLMNIMRAGDDLPLVFTGLMVVRGAGNTAVGANVGVSQSWQTSKSQGIYAHTSATSLAPGASLQVSSGFNFDVAVLDSAEFLGGLLTPIGVEALHALSKRGVPAELILFLMVERITLTVNGVATTYVNDPSDPDYARFRTTLTNLLRMGLTTEMLSSGAPVGPLLTETELKANLPSMFTAAQAGLLPFPEPGGYRFVKSNTAARLCFMGGADGPPLPQTSLCAASPKKTPASAASKSPAQPIGALSLTDDRQMAVQTRSTRDVYGYLGRLARRQTHDGREGVMLELPDTAGYQNAARGRSLFKVVKDRPRPDDLFAVEYRGSVYSLPNEEQGYTATVLAVLQQFFSLSKSVNSVPATGTVVVR